MPFDSASLVRQVLSLHANTVDRWHAPDFLTGDLDNAYTGLLAVICQQHQFNFLLWHEEDVARRSDVDDRQIAAIRRSIDKLNQQRNDWVERIDETLIQMLTTGGVTPAADARLNTETPGSVCDRLSILSLRIFHLQEELEREDVESAPHEKVQQRIARCRVQLKDLSQSLVELLQDVFAGRKLLKVYRQMKMYHDPAINPEPYKRKAG